MGVLANFVANVQVSVPATSAIEVESCGRGCDADDRFVSATVRPPVALSDAAGADPSEDERKNGCKRLTSSGIDRTPSNGRDPEGGGMRRGLTACVVPR